MTVYYNKNLIEKGDDTCECANVEKLGRWLKCLGAGRRKGAKGKLPGELFLRKGKGKFFC